MRTYRAELAPWRMEKLHENFIEAARDHARLLRQPGPKRYAYETTCPYCGRKGKLVGTIRIGAKEQVEGIPMTSDGFEVPDARDRDTEILVVHCDYEDCDAAIDPMAYLSPAVFWANKEDVDIWGETLP